MRYKIMYKCGHFEVHINGKFYCYVGTLEQAANKIENYTSFN